jgi:hypothetical protein
MSEARQNDELYGISGRGCRFGIPLPQPHRSKVVVISPDQHLGDAEGQHLAGRNLCISFWHFDG